MSNRSLQDKAHDAIEELADLASSYFQTIATMQDANDQLEEQKAVLVEALQEIAERTSHPGHGDLAPLVAWIDAEAKDALAKVED
jgi:hypothetical protein